MTFGMDMIFRQKVKVDWNSSKKNDDSKPLPTMTRKTATATKLVISSSLSNPNTNDPRKPNSLHPHRAPLRSSGSIPMVTHASGAEPMTKMYPSVASARISPMTTKAPQHSISNDTLRKLIISWERISYADHRWSLLIMADQLLFLIRYS
jgi:hypothetical protein